MPAHDRPSPPTVRTPPPTSLTDGDSPTTSDPNILEIPMANHRRCKPLYLIVATAVEPPGGIGYRGGLPWSRGLRSDMAFFRRVTTRGAWTGDGKMKEGRGRNAVIMGRKTWESIPGKFRPLRDRVNVVVTRHAPKLLQKEFDGTGTTTSGGVERQGTTILFASSVSEALKVLRELRQQDDASPTTTEEGKDFLIGGSEIYKAALDLASSQHHLRLSDEIPEEDGLTLRILQTQVRRKDGGAFPCDTFFPVDLHNADEMAATGWRTVSQAEAEIWAGETLPQQQADWTDDAEGQCQIRIVGWEKRR